LILLFALLKELVRPPFLIRSWIGDDGTGIHSSRRVRIERSGGVSAGEQESPTDAGAEFRIGDFLGGG
jgi:hypothetical protein